MQLTRAASQSCFYVSLIESSEGHFLIFEMKRVSESQIQFSSVVCVFSTDQFTYKSRVVTRGICGF